VFLTNVQDSVLQDGAGHKPAYNLRTLSRALEYASTTLPVYGMQRALYDGFAMSFLTQLDPGSTSVLEKLLVQHLIGEGTSLKVRPTMRNFKRFSVLTYTAHFIEQSSLLLLRCFK